MAPRDFRSCMDSLVEDEEMTTEQAKRILNEYEDVFEEMRDDLGLDAARVEAARETIERLGTAQTERRRRKQLEAAVAKRQTERMREYRDMSGRPDPGLFLQHLVHAPHGFGASTLAGRFEAVRRSARARMTRSLVDHRADLLGMRRNRQQLANVERELFGEHTGDARAAKIAEDFRAVSEVLRVRFNAAGGNIQKRKDWGLPQRHDPHRVRKAGYEQWRRTILPALDLVQMGRWQNNGKAYTERTIEPILKRIYEHIRTEGYSARDPAARDGEGSLALRRVDPRVLKFKNRAMYSMYSRNFGDGLDTFRVMMGHIDEMASEIAQMEVLGPSPSNMFRFLADAAKHAAARSGEDGALKLAAQRVKVAEQMFDLFTGTANMPVSPRFAKAMAALRNLQVAAHLGRAVLSSVTDFNHQRIASQFAGLSQTGFFRQMVRLARSATIRAQANEAGLIWENAVNIGNAVARYELEDLHVEWAARLADFTIRSTGLGWLTETHRQAFGLEFMSQLAKWREGSWSVLPASTRRLMEAHGIGEGDWPAIIATRVHRTPDGLALLRPRDIEATGSRDLADRLMELIVNQTNFAVPTSNVWGRAHVLFGTRPGTIPGELLRSGLQFKAWPITVMVEQFGRIMREIRGGRKMNAASYAANMVLGSTILGAIAVILKDVNKGRDPRDVTTSRFWIAALAQGGGAGIFGDFAFNDQSRFGGGLSQTLAGPTATLLDDIILDFGVGNLQQIARGDDPAAGRELTNLLRRYLPAGSAWYLQTPLRRGVIDELQRAIDPKASDSFHARVRNAAKYDSGYWWTPGDRLPARGPDWRNMAGGSRR